MTPDVDIHVTQDLATPAVDKLEASLRPAEIVRAVGTACVRLTQDHLNAMPHNKQGWPPQNFYQGAARGTTWNPTPEGVVISIDNQAHPGAMRQRFHGGPIYAKDHLLTIPARAEFYGQRATMFTNLRFVMFGRGGAMALVIGTGGVGKINISSGQERSVSGAGARSAGMVAYWLREEVNQDPDPTVIPTDDEYAETSINAVIDLLDRKGALK